MWFLHYIILHRHRKCNNNFSHDNHIFVFFTKKCDFSGGGSFAGYNIYYKVLNINYRALTMARGQMRAAAFQMLIMNVKVMLFLKITNL